MKDGIIAANKIHLNDFVAHYNEPEGKRLIEAIAGCDNTGKQLGYSRFQWDKQGLGDLVISNYDAKLKPSNSGLGRSKKHGDNSQAGSHGEGVKLAALVLIRDPHFHVVRCYSAGFSWKFHFKRTKAQPLPTFNLAIRRLTDQQIEYARKYDINSIKDVTFVIGARGVSNIVNSDGRIVEAEKFRLEDVRESLKVCFDINPPEARITTNYGTLILDPDFKNHVYLKGLRLSSGSRSGREFVYGYDFREGSTERDRTYMSSSYDEKMNVNKIWHSIIMDKDFCAQAAKYNILDKYIHLWNRPAEQEEIADAPKPKSVPHEIVIKMWELLHAKANDSCQKFYFCEKDGEEVRHKC